MLPAQPSPALISALVFLLGTKSPARLCKYDGSDGSDGSEGSEASVGPCDPSPHCREARRVAWQQLLSVLMGYNYIGIVSFLHYHQYTHLTALLFIRKITAQLSSAQCPAKTAETAETFLGNIKSSSLQSPNIFYSRKNVLSFNAFCGNYL